NNNFTGQGSVGFPAAVVIAATWNNELANKFGDSIGTMADQMDTAGWYGPAMNIHRTAFAGRNFEYYSEDGVLSGDIAASAIQGAQAHGVYAYMKHFALNDQETNRTSMLCTWANEQAIREVYLKPFEKSVKDGGSLAVMSSFNYIGNCWAGGCSELLEDVLRGEWGFKGFVETDYFGVYGYMNADQAIRNGTDLMLVNYATEANDMKYTETAGAQQKLRQSAKRILYVVANSRQYSELGIEQSQQPNRWETILKVVDVCAAIILIAWEILLIVNFNKRRKEVVVEQAE
ncbi:MAG: glycoside hydrolase family 3 N-terminal domain-containing protein, partial [Eubacterium sp.]|nr:glycoside hydrolase family 3 N-terminal domain-containing protein [Eubacterium sp.]